MCGSGLNDNTPSMASCRGDAISSTPIATVQPQPQARPQVRTQPRPAGEEQREHNTDHKCTCLSQREPERSVLHGRDPEYYCEKDIYTLVQTFAALLQSCYFYQDLNSSDAKHLLKPCEIGTFIVRNSSDPRYIYTISVKTKRGPTSIRVTYDKGHFSLDADEKSKGKMPKFSSLLSLIDYYVRLTSVQRSEQCRFVDRAGKKDLPIILSTPKLKSVPSLKHLSRACINRTLPATKSEEIPTEVERLPLPGRLKSYIKDFPYLH